MISKKSEASASVLTLLLVPVESDEALRMLTGTAGKELNLTDEEHQQLKALPISPPLDTRELDLFNRAYHDILEQRHQRYMAQGIAGIAAYRQHRGGDFDPATHLRATNEGFTWLEPYAPDLYRDLIEFSTGNAKRPQALLLLSGNG